MKTVEIDLVPCIHSSITNKLKLNTSTLSSLADTQNVSCLGLCGRDICPKSSAKYGPSVVSIYINK